MASKKKYLRIFFCFLFITAGLLHFLKPAPFLAIMPDYFPAKLFLVYLSGFLEIAGAIGLYIDSTRKIACWGLILLLLAVFPANLNMALNPSKFAEIPQPILWLRLPLQAVLIWCVFLCSSMKAKVPESSGQKDR